MNNTRTTLLSIFMILIMIGMMIIPGAMADPVDSYTVSVSSGQSTSITTTTNVTFGELNPGTSDNTIADSFNLTNAGNTDCVVSGTYSTYNTTSDIYGLTNDTYDAIGGSNFSMYNTDSGSWIDLDDVTEVTELTGNNVVADAVADVWSVRLDIPSGQEAANYTGTVQITFADA